MSSVPAIVGQYLQMEHVIFQPTISANFLCYTTDLFRRTILADNNQSFVIGFRISDLSCVPCTSLCLSIWVKSVWRLGKWLHTSAYHECFAMLISDLESVHVSIHHDVTKYLMVVSDLYFGARVCIVIHQTCEVQFTEPHAAKSCFACQTNC